MYRRAARSTPVPHPRLGRAVGFINAAIRDVLRGKMPGFKFCMILIALAEITSAPAMAKVTFPVNVPQECVELAQREGVPVVINSKYEATTAKFKLARLRDRDPLVHECRAAVERARRAALQYDH
jgi:hypothetical protein